MIDPYVVRVRVSSGQPLADAMNRLRIWLDHQKIQPAEFKTITDAKGYALDIAFRSVTDAERFRRQLPDDAVAS